MTFMLGWEETEISGKARTKIRTYLGDYRPFFRRFFRYPSRQVDRALWAFGKFLKSHESLMKLSLHEATRR